MWRSAVRGVQREHAHAVRTITVDVFEMQIGEQVPRCAWTGGSAAFVEILDLIPALKVERLSLRHVSTLGREQVGDSMTGSVVDTPGEFGDQHFDLRADFGGIVTGVRDAHRWLREGGMVIVGAPN